MATTKLSFQKKSSTCHTRQVKKVFLFTYHESKCSLIVLVLDKARNLTFKEDLTNNETGIIHFQPPRGNYDIIHITCYPRDEHCLNQAVNLTNSTGSGTNCTSIVLHPILRGVEYQCTADTIKTSFQTVRSANYYFNTSNE